MITYIIQTIDLLVFDQVHFFGIFFIFVWLVWMLKATLSLFYKKYEVESNLSTSVIVPVVDEDAGYFNDVLQRIVKQNPGEVIVVINGVKNSKLERVCLKYKEQGLRFIWEETPGKRNAVRVGIENSKNEIIVIVDSDTLWEKDTLKELLKPFSEDTIGGVTTKQVIYKPDRNILTRFANWLEVIRAENSMPAMSYLGTVGCLPGRTIAIRKKILIKVLPKFLNDVFLGTHLEVSDDRALTNYTLQEGYRTVYQESSVVYTDSPTDFKKYIRQQLRWAKGSQYNNLKMFFWMLLRAPILFLFYMSDIIIPFFLVGVFVNLFYKVLNASSNTEIIKETNFDNIGYYIIFAFIGATVGIGIRHWSHLAKKPKDILYLPLFIVFLTVILAPIRIIGFATMAQDSSWGTRSNGYAAGTSPVKINSKWVSLQRFVPYLLTVMLLLFFILGGIAVENS